MAYIIFKLWIILVTVQRVILAVPNFCIRLRVLIRRGHTMAHTLWYLATNGGCHFATRVNCRWYPNFIRRCLEPPKLSHRQNVPLYCIQGIPASFPAKILSFTFFVGVWNTCECFVTSAKVSSFCRVVITVHFI